MEAKIRKYFMDEKKVTEQVARIVSKSLLKYEDIAEEFCWWLDNRKLREENCLTIEGYTAADICEMAPQLDMAGVYNFMVTLRDDPEKAKETMEKNFPTK